MTDMTAAQAAQQNNRDGAGKYATKAVDESGVELGGAPGAVWPQNDEERAAYEDYRTEAADGDTAIGFRDWYDARNGKEITAPDGGVWPRNGQERAAMSLYRDLVSEGSTAVGFRQWHDEGNDLKWRYSDMEGIEAIDDMDTDEVATLRVLIDPANDPWGRDEDELVETMSLLPSFSGAESLSGHDEVANIVATSWGAAEGDPQLGAPGTVVVDVPNGDSGESPYYHMRMTLGPDANGVCLSISDDSRYLADGEYDREGLHAAVAAARVVDLNIARLRGQGVAMGLISPEGAERRKKVDS